MSSIGVDLPAGESRMMDWAQATRDYGGRRAAQATPVLERVLREYPDSSLAGSAQWMLLQQEIREKPPVIRAHRLQRFLGAYRSPEWLGPATSQLVTALLEAGRQADARAVVRDFAEKWPGSSLVPELRRASGLDTTPAPDPVPANAHWDELNKLKAAVRWGELQQGLREHLTRFPESPRRDEAIRELMRVVRHHMPGDEPEVRYLEEFVASRNPMPGADLAAVRLAHRYLERGDHAKAASLFEKVANEWPHSIYAPRALVDAGLARLALGQRAACLTNLQKAEVLTFDPYDLRDIVLARGYANSNGRWTEMLEKEYSVIEDPATSVGRRAEAHARVNVLHALVPPNRDPRQAAIWNVRLFIFKRLDHEWTTKDNEPRHTKFELTPEMIADIQTTFGKYKEDVFRYSRGALRIESEIRILDESAKVTKVDWNRDNPHLFWNAHGHPLEKMPNRTAGPFQSDFWVIPAEGLPAWAPAGAGGPAKETGKGDVTYMYGPGWKDWFRYVYVHEWLHNVDGAFWLNGWQPQWNLSHDHCGRDWNSRWPDSGDPEWCIGFIKGWGEHEEDWCAFYRWTMSNIITPRMWSQAKLEGIRGEQGATLSTAVPLRHGSR